MQTVIQSVNNLTNALLILAAPVLIIALIVAGLNMASADSGRHEKAKRQLIGIAVAAIVIFGAKVIVQALVSFVPGANVSF
jgi:uncharacterized membrane protein YoaK (UPF0700 family)